MSLYYKEKEKIDRYVDELNNDKIIVRRTQRYLNRDLERYEDEYNHYKINDPHNLKKYSLFLYTVIQFRKSLLNRLKGTLDTQFKQLNADLIKLRESEYLLKN